MLKIIFIILLFLYIFYPEICDYNQSNMIGQNDPFNEDKLFKNVIYGNKFNIKYDKCST